MLNYHLYADDTQVIAKSTIRSTDVACRQLENCVASVQQWCASRRLQLNADKTELIWFGSAAHLEHLQAESVGLTIAGVNVEAVDCVRDLGVYLDSRLNLRAHIGRVVSTCYFHLRRLRHLRHMVSQEVRQRLVSALILSRIDYCNVIFAGTGRHSGTTTSSHERRTQPCVLWQVWVLVTM